MTQHWQADSVIVQQRQTFFPELQQFLAGGNRANLPFWQLAFTRFPSSLDIDAAAISDALMDPCPVPAAVLLLSGGPICLAGLQRFHLPTVAALDRESSRSSAS
jgi:hypothetical protein